MKYIFLFFIIFFTFSFSNDDLYFIDAHSQIDHKNEGLTLVLQKMKENNVKKTLLTTRGQRSPLEIIEWSKSNPEIIPIMRTKGKMYTNNTNEFYRMMLEQQEYKSFKGISEILLYHAQKGNKAPEIIVDLNDKRFKTILDINLKNNWPTILHIEFASLSSSEKNKYMTDMKKLLNTYPDKPFLLIHMGQLESDEVLLLLENYSNIYFITSHADKFAGSSQPWINLFSSFGGFKSEWKELFIKYPEHFIFALDNVWSEQWVEIYSKRISLWKDALEELPYDIANKISHGNAERMWKLN